MNGVWALKPERAQGRVVAFYPHPSKTIPPFKQLLRATYAMPIPSLPVIIAARYRTRIFSFLAMGDFTWLVASVLHQGQR
jgi:hypothetical protein